MTASLTGQSLAVLSPTLIAPSLNEDGGNDIIDRVGAAMGNAQPQVALDWLNASAILISVPYGQVLSHGMPCFATRQRLSSVGSRIRQLHITVQRLQQQTNCSAESCNEYVLVDCAVLPGVRIAQPVKLGPSVFVQLLQQAPPKFFDLIGVPHAFRPAVVDPLVKKVFYHQLLPLLINGIGIGTPDAVFLLRHKVCHITSLMEIIFDSDKKFIFRN